MSVAVHQPSSRRVTAAKLEENPCAQKTITLETYIWSTGYISNQFIDALSERARAGVKVHALLDGMGGLKLSRNDRDRLRDAGVQLYIYGREHWWQVKPNINHRTHRKLLIIDGKVGFTGGFCIDDRWLGNAHAKDLWRETQVRVEGPAVRQMQAVFAHNWMQTTSSLLLGGEFHPDEDCRRDEEDEIDPDPAWNTEGLHGHASCSCGSWCFWGSWCSWASCLSARRLRK